MLSLGVASRHVDGVQGEHLQSASPREGHHKAQSGMRIPELYRPSRDLPAGSARKQLHSRLLRRSEDPALVIHRVGTSRQIVANGWP
jgi:hypothetical protein